LASCAGFGYLLFSRAACAIEGCLVPDTAGFLAPPGFRLVSAEEFADGQGTPVRVVHPDPGLRLTFAPERPMPGDWYQFELRFPPEGLVDVAACFAFAEDVLWLRLPALARNHFVAHFRLEHALQELTLIVTGSGRLTAPDACGFRRVGLSGQLAAAARRGIDIFRRDGLRVIASGASYLWRLTRPESIAFARGSAAAAGEPPYDTWMRIFDEAPERDRARHAERLAALARRPLVSVLVRAPSTLDRVAAGLASQIYPDWELVVAAPTDRHAAVATALAGLGTARLRLVEAGTDAVDGLNAALGAAQGEFILPLAEGELLRPHALLDLALTVERVPQAGLVYTDEDRLDAGGQRRDWRFKPAWSPALLQAADYLGSLTLMRRDTVRALGGWRSGATHGHRHDLLLRLTDRAAPPTIVHLAKLLVHVVEPAPVPHVETARPRVVPSPAPRVSLIIPTRDGADVLETCVRSIRSHTRYDNYEIIIVDNGSTQEQTRKLFAALSSDPAIRILPRPEPFNFSRLNNAAARAATGTILGLVNNDIEVTDGEWLGEMVALAMQPDVGCVGARLLYPDGRLQHAGVVVGLGGVAGHGHRFAPASDPGYLGRLHTVHEVSAVTAACLLIRRDAFDAVHGLDEGLTVAFNDVDFCLRVRAAGYRNLWTPFAALVHHESVSRGRDLTPAKARRFAGEFAMMRRRWGADLLHDPYYSPHLTYDLEDFSLRLR
jgi:GT2 family glycosyltransferase